MKPSNRHHLLVVAALLGGCAASHYHARNINSSTISFPNGTKGYVIHCAGDGTDLSACETEATRLCGGLYGVVDKTGMPSTVPKVVDGTLTIACQMP